MKWYTPLLTSEISFFFHLPYFLQLKTGNIHIQTGIFVIRNVINTVIFTLLFQHAVWTHPHTFITAMIDSNYQSLAFILFVISTILWLFTNTYIHYHTKDVPLAFNSIIYYIAHFSIVNFIFDISSIGMPSTRIPYKISIILNLIIAIGLIKFIFVDEVLNDAWGAYNPIYYPNITTYIYGMAPTGRDASRSPFWNNPNMIRGQAERDNISDIDTFVHFTIILLFVKLVVYFISIPSEVEFYIINN